MVVAEHPDYTAARAADLRPVHVHDALARAVGGPVLENAPVRPSVRWDVIVVGDTT